MNDKFEPVYRLAGSCKCGHVIEFTNGWKPTQNHQLCLGCKKFFLILTPPKFKVVEAVPLFPEDRL